MSPPHVSHLNHGICRVSHRLRNGWTKSEFIFIFLRYSFFFLFVPQVGIFFNIRFMMINDMVNYIVQREADDNVCNNFHAMFEQLRCRNDVGVVCSGIQCAHIYCILGRMFSMPERRLRPEINIWPGKMKLLNPAHRHYVSVASGDRNAILLNAPWECSVWR